MKINFQIKIFLLKSTPTSLTICFKNSGFIVQDDVTKFDWLFRENLLKSLFTYEHINFMFPKEFHLI